MNDIIDVDQTNIVDKGFEIKNSAYNNFRNIYLEIHVLEMYEKSLNI